MRLKKARNSADFRRSSATGKCELRTRIFGLSLAMFRAAPPGTRFRPGRTLGLNGLAEVDSERRKFGGPLAHQASYQTILRRQHKEGPPEEGPVGLSRHTTQACQQTTSCGVRCQQRYMLVQHSCRWTVSSCPAVWGARVTARQGGRVAFSLPSAACHMLQMPAPTGLPPPSMAYDGESLPTDCPCASGRFLRPQRGRRR